MVSSVFTECTEACREQIAFGFLLIGLVVLYLSIRQATNIAASLTCLAPKSTVIK